MNDAKRLRVKKTIEVPPSSWYAWMLAARTANVTRQAFIIAVCDAAAKQLMGRYREKDKYTEIGGKEHEDI